MEHSLPLISTLVIAFSLALVFGFIAERFLKAPALVGYLLAGIAAGKYTPGVFADAALANQLSEIGVMLLMFGVGLHFSMKDLWSVKSIAVPGAVLQMAIATLLGALCAHWFFDRSWGEAIVLGISLSCASTVVLLKALDVRGKLASSDGRIAVGWLVVEDLATVIILVLLPPFASIMIPGEPGTTARLAGSGLAFVILKTLLNAALFVAIMLVIGRRVLPWAMGQVARTGSRELFTLFVLAVAVGVAYGAAEIFHVSFALGSFFAGMVMRESRFAHRAATESIPLQDAFAVLFFVAVGMLFDWHILITSPFEVLAVLFIILFGKSLAAFLLVHTLRYPLHTAIIVAVSLSQIGEFSFILIGQAAGLGLADQHLVNLVVAGAILSIALNPVGFWLEPKISKALTSRWSWARKAAMREAPFEALPAETVPEKLSGQVVVTGPANLTECFALQLDQASVPLVAVVDDEAAAENLAAKGIAVILGDPSKDDTWVSAHLHQARLLVLLDSSVDAFHTAEAARRVAPELPIVVAAESRGIWPEADFEHVTYLSTIDAAARLFSAQTASALKAGASIGEPIGTHAEETRQEESMMDEELREEAVPQDVVPHAEKKPRPVRKLANFLKARLGQGESKSETKPAEPAPKPEPAPAEPAPKPEPAPAAPEEAKADESKEDPLAGTEASSDALPPQAPTGKNAP